MRTEDSRWTRGRARRASAVLLASATWLPVLGCAGHLSPEFAAILTVAAELRGELPNVARGQRLVVAPMWINGDSLPPELLVRLREVTDLPVWDMAAPRDGSVAALAFHPPKVAGDGGIAVGVELLTFDDRGFHGRDWRFELDCLDGCHVVERWQTPGWMN